MSLADLFTNESGEIRPIFDLDGAISQTPVGSLPPGWSEFVFGALGGFVFLARQAIKGYAIQPAEYWARPLVGAAAAFLFVVGLGFPNHATSVICGIIGIGIIDLAVDRLEKRLGREVKLPGWRHLTKDELEAEILRRIREREGQP